MLRKKRIALAYGLAVVIWVIGGHRFTHLLVPPSDGSDESTEAAEDVAMLSGGLTLVWIGSRHSRRISRELDAVRAKAVGSLRARAAQQAAVAALGQRALEGLASRDLAREATETVRRTLEVDACSVLEHLPAEGAFRMRATSGFDEGALDSIVAYDGRRSMSGYTLLTGRPLHLSDWRTETRFSPSRYLLERGVVSVSTTLIAGTGRPYGVVSVCTKTHREFTQDDTSFLQSVANVLAAALERERISDEANRFFDMSQDLLGIAGYDGLIRRANPAWSTAMGYDVKALVGTPFADLVHPDDRGFTMDAIGQIIATGGELPSLENRYVAADGSAHLLQWTVRADPERRLLYAVARDVTSRRRMEADHALLARTIAQAAETVMITGPDAVIQYVNPAFERVTGYPRDEIVGRTPSVLKSGRQDQAFYASLWKRLTTGDLWTGRFVNRRKDGTIYQAEGTITPVRDPAGALVNYVAVMRDVTHEVQLEAQFRQSQKLEVVGQLAGGVAHDFNNLLCVIGGYGDLLRDELPPDDPLRGHVAQIRAAAERASALTRQLLAFSRKQDMKPRIIDVNSAVRDSAKLWNRLLGENVRLLTDAAADAGRIRADASQLDQVLMNLAVNARDAMPDGGTLTVETRNVHLDAAFVAEHLGARAGRYVRISVVDTGVGVDAATMAHIFEPFFTTKAPGKGSGLGLATVYGIVQQSDGFVEVESEPGCGAAFRVYLPRVDEEVTSQDAAAPRVRESARRGAERILVAEDSEAVRGLMCQVLRQAGYAVDACASGEEAVAAATSRGPFALFLSDIVMTGASGPETARRVSAVQPTIRVLFVSGHTSEVMRRNGLTDADAEVLRKPFSTDELLRKVRAVLDTPLRPLAAGATA